VIVQYLLVFALFSATCGSAQEALKAGNAEEEIRALETVRLKSPTKTEVWSGNVAKDALFQLGNGSVASKQDLLTHMQHQGMEDSLEMSDTMFSQIGDAAIFSYVFRRTHPGDGRPDTHQHIRRTLVYQRTGSGWQMIASAVAIIPYADLEAKPVDRKILDTYLGVWTAAPASSTITVTLEGGKLMAKGSEDTEKYEFLALSDSTFVIQGDPKLITFEKGPDGKVTRLLFRDVGGSVDVYQRSLTDRKYR
jgi:ketosteroid isomerase-like protein